MQSGLVLCILALPSIMDAAHLRAGAAQVPVAVNDLMNAQVQSTTEVGGPSLQSMTASVSDAGVSLAASSASNQQLVQSQAQNVASRVTKIAFGQITNLGSEFKQLREDDEVHVRQLGVDVHLREHLQQQLHEAEERLAVDNTELAQETQDIVAGPSRSSGVPANSTDDLALPPAFVQTESFTANVPTDQIALATARDVQAIDAHITSLRARDANEVKALQGNAQMRGALGMQIAKERDELMANSESLAVNLGQIRNLIGSSDTAAKATVAPADSSPAAPSDPATESQTGTMPPADTVPEQPNDSAASL
eukprot:gnl/MRDRNA2_/MRDRNA2_50662_c0_seq1.p1 gnl/MRDRNA2_/MRDRNA2_50662_c0~~gnl/MRDRNA2_/MRDRNA2_50662_c0_seq1.p1  ORF type:complete len:309 (-),score=72.14 gnl/MRDRNA2_/MRDRNA2_50662_c0_seq1:52-978(-)